MAILRSATVILLSTVSSVIAQDLMATDQQLGLNHHQQVLAHYQLISQGQIYERLQRVFTRMTQTPDFNGGANLRYQLFYLDSSEINAYSVGGGTMYVTAGLMQAIQGNEGVLAFVMGHEMVHSRNQHLAKKQLRLAVMNYQYRQIFKQNGQLAATIYLTAARISEAKVDRDAEHEADQVGLRIAAEAGYHPDYAIFAARVLRAEAGEQSKFAAFFSTHPRWTTREERTEHNYDSALAVFGSSWPSVDESPGGRPPAIAIVSQLRTEKKQRDVLVSTVVRVKNLRGVNADVKFELIGEHEPEPVFLASKTYAADQTARDPIAITIQPAVWEGRTGKQYVRVRLVAGPEELYSSKLTRAK